MLSQGPTAGAASNVSSRLQPASELCAAGASLRPSSAEWESVEALRRRVRGDGALKSLVGGERWMEGGELLRFVRARSTLEEQEELFRAAMAWRLDHARSWGVATTDGSFGAEFAKYQHMSSRPGEGRPPDWWAFLEQTVPQVYSTEQRSATKHAPVIKHSNTHRN